MRIGNRLLAFACFGTTLTLNTIMSDIPRNGVLLSWADRDNDPFTAGTERTPGPNLSLLFDLDSPYRSRISDVVLFYQEPKQAPKKHANYVAARRTQEEIEKRSRPSSPTVKLIPWPGEDVSELEPILTFLRQKVTEIGEQYTRRPLVIHISPGPKMVQTAWILMSATGAVRKPYVSVKSLRPADRKGRPAVVPIELSLPTLYNVLQETRPQKVSAQEEEIFWDPKRFVSDKLKRLYEEEAPRYARMQTPILILGERGTGKTSLASWIRLNSPYRQQEKDKSWPSVPCGMYSSETMRSELFGYVKGAFTDAREDTEGLLHVADGDTLFLDEIGDLPNDLQRLLIRALEEKHFTRVGARVPEKSNFRLLTATNRSWDELTERLDLDFLDRISQLVLVMPALHELREDLSWIWRKVYQLALKRALVSDEPMKLTDAQHEKVIQLLCQHPLPGNLRDLFRVANRLIATHLEEPALDSVENAVQKALTQRLGQEIMTIKPDVARAVARAFSGHEPLPLVLDEEHPLQTYAVLHAMRQYLGEEIRRVARQKGVKPHQLCDVSDRALQKWVKEYEQEV